MMHRMVRLVLALAACAAATRGTASDGDLGGKAAAFLEKYCYRCHGQNGANEGGFDYALDFSKLVGKKVKPNDIAGSSLYKRLALKKDMPPEEEKVRPNDDEIRGIREWIEAGAPGPKLVVEPARPFRSTRDVMQVVRDHLRATPPADRAFARYFTLTHLYNLPVAKVKDIDMRLYRAALSKLVNSLSWKPRIVIPKAIDPEGTILAVDVRDLDWDRRKLWQEMLKPYPYGLKHDRYPDDDKANQLAREIYELSGIDLPWVRADWFISTAARPGPNDKPEIAGLYHTMLQLPDNAKDLERQLDVDVVVNFRRDQAKRAAFNKSGVSGQNRMIERHDARHGAYWKSYDFKSNDGDGNLFVFPLGPRFSNHPFERQAFQHDGGEIIFNLPNGLQGYMLVDGKDKRINAGPVEVVSDSKKTSGTPAIVNGLSCMACHAHGMLPDFTDAVREGSALAGEARDKLRRLYVKPDEMRQLVQDDTERFLRALDQAMAPFLKVGPDAGKDIRDFPEPVSHIARYYLLQEIGPEEAARELGMPAAAQLVGAIQANPRLKELGLGPLVQGNTIKREVWESLRNFISAYQEAAQLLDLGTPKRYQ